MIEPLQRSNGADAHPLRVRMSAWILAQGGDGYALNATISPSAIAKVFEQ